MPKPREKKPTVEERAKLKALFTDTCLLGAHGIVIENVRTYLADLLRCLGRPDLAEHVADFDALLRE